MNIGSLRNDIIIKLKGNYVVRCYIISACCRCG